MKKTNLWKRVVAAFLMMALVFGVVQTTQVTTVQAASKKLTKKDITKTSGADKFNFMKLYASNKCAFIGAYEGDDVTTKRGITIGDSKSDVTKKYGKASIKKVNKKKDNIFYAAKKKGFSGTLKGIKQSKRYTEYKYNQNRTEYRLRFYFDKNNKIVLITYIKNYSEFRSVF